MSKRFEILQRIIIYQENREQYTFEERKIIREELRLDLKKNG